MSRAHLELNCQPLPQALRGRDLLSLPTITLILNLLTCAVLLGNLVYQIRQLILLRRRSRQ